jgi:hypothetical protein
MMREKLKSLLGKKYVIVLIGVASFSLLVMIQGALKKPTVEPRPVSLWQDSSKGASEGENLSNYQKLKAMNEKGPQKKLAREVEEKNKQMAQVKVEKKETKKPLEARQSNKTKAREREKYDHEMRFIRNLEAGEELRYVATFKGAQVIKNEKSIQLLLQDEINMPGLKLKKATILNALPSLLGERIYLKITSAGSGKQVIDLRKYSLVCKDNQGDEGLYHDMVAKILAEQVQNKAKQEVRSELMQYGFFSKVTDAALSIADGMKDMIVEDGKIVLLEFPGE